MLVMYQADGDRLTACPKDETCSVGVDLAVVPPEGSSTSDLATAAYYSLSTSSFQVHHSCPACLARLTMSLESSSHLSECWHFQLLHMPP